MDVIVVEAVWVEMLMTVSVERDTKVTIEEVTPCVDCAPCNTPCSGLTIAMAKMRETITETAMRDANTSSSLSWRFKRDVSARGQDGLYSVMYWLCVRSGEIPKTVEDCDFLGLLYYENLRTGICNHSRGNASK